MTTTIEQKTKKELINPHKKYCGACCRNNWYPKQITFTRFHMRDKEYMTLTGFICKYCGHLVQE